MSCFARVFDVGLTLHDGIDISNARDGSTTPKKILSMKVKKEQLREQ